jgi:predicted AAA+ superfamily ATPase
MGPRQVGETTLIGQLITQLDVDYIFESADAVAASDIVWINALWDKARTKIKTKNLEEYLLIIDEIQKIDN